MLFFPVKVLAGKAFLLIYLFLSTIVTFRKRLLCDHKRVKCDNMKTAKDERSTLFTSVHGIRGKSEHYPNSVERTICSL